MVFKLATLSASAFAIAGLALGASPSVVAAEPTDGVSVSVANSASAQRSATASSAPRGDDATPSCRGQEATVGKHRGKIVGTKKADVIVATGRATIRARAGNDLVCGSAKRDRIRGSKGRDTVYAGRGGDRVWGGKGRDQIFGEGGPDRLNGGKRPDRLFGGPGSNTYNGSPALRILTTTRANVPDRINDEANVLQVRIPDASLEPMESVTIERPVQGSESPRRIAWQAFRPFSSNTITWPNGGLVVFASPSAVLPGANVLVSAQADVNPGDVITWEANGTFSFPVAQGGQSIGIQIAELAGQQSFGIGQSGTVNGQETPYTPLAAAPALPKEILQFATSNGVGISVGTDERAGSVLSDNRPPASRYEIPSRGAVLTVDYDARTGQFTRVR